MAPFSPRLNFFSVRHLDFSPARDFAVLLYNRPPRSTGTPAGIQNRAVVCVRDLLQVTTDYGYADPRGGTLGLQYTRYLRWYLTPSIEFRAKSTFGGRTVNERTWGGGIRFERRLRNLRPYGNFFVMSGTIHYNFSHPYNPHPTVAPYTWDNSIVYSPGLGVDYNISRYWAARFDYQFEFWNLGNSQTLTPKVLSVGVIYRIHFRPE